MKTVSSNCTCVPEIVQFPGSYPSQVNLCGFSFPTSDKVGFNRQYHTLRSPKTPETRKIGRILASSQGEFELVWIEISFRSVMYTPHLTATYRYFLGGRAPWKMHHNRIFQLLGKSIASAIFPPFQKRENYITRPLCDDRRVLHEQRIVRIVKNIQIQSRAVYCSLKPRKERIAVKSRTREPQHHTEVERNIINNDNTTQAMNISLNLDSHTRRG